MLRISLIIAIVAGLAAAGLNFYKVRQVMVDTKSQLDTTTATLADTQNQLSETNKVLETTIVELEGTNKKLAQTQTELKTTTDKMVAAEEQVAALKTDLTKSNAERDAADQKLSRWEGLGVQPEEIKGLIASLAQTKEELTIVKSERTVFAKKAEQLQAKIDDILGPDRPVELPLGLKGRVIAVDPKFDFVVIDVGGDKGALERGEMLVNRNGHLIGRIRIAAVQPNQSIANVIPAWKKEGAEIMEGDMVFYAKF